MLIDRKKLRKNTGLDRDLNPGPLTPKARIIPLDHQATSVCYQIVLELMQAGQFVKHQYQKLSYHSATFICEFYINPELYMTNGENDTFRFIIMHFTQLVILIGHFALGMIYL